MSFEHHRRSRASARRSVGGNLLAGLEDKFEELETMQRKSQGGVHLSCPTTPTADRNDSFLLAEIEAASRKSAVRASSRNVSPTGRKSRGVVRMNSEQREALQKMDAEMKPTHPQPAGGKKQEEPASGQSPILSRADTLPFHDKENDVGQHKSAPQKNTVSCLKKPDATEHEKKAQHPHYLADYAKLHPEIKARIDPTPTRKPTQVLSSRSTTTVNGGGSGALRTVSPWSRQEGFTPAERGQGHSSLRERALERKTSPGAGGAARYTSSTTSLLNTRKTAINNGESANRITTPPSNVRTGRRTLTASTPTPRKTSNGAVGGGSTSAKKGVNNISMDEIHVKPEPDEELFGFSDGTEEKKKAPAATSSFTPGFAQPKSNVDGTEESIFSATFREKAASQSKWHLPGSGLNSTFFKSCFDDERVTKEIEWAPADEGETPMVMNSAALSGGAIKNDGHKDNNEEVDDALPRGSDESSTSSCLSKQRHRQEAAASAYLLKSTVDTLQEQIKTSIFLGSVIGPYRAKTMKSVLARDLDAFLVQNKLKKGFELSSIPKATKIKLVCDFLVENGY